MLMLMVFLLACFRQYERFISMIPGFESEGLVLDKSCLYCFSSASDRQQGSSTSDGSSNVNSAEAEVVEAGRRLVEVGKKQLARSISAAALAAGAGGSGGGLGGVGVLG